MREGKFVFFIEAPRLEYEVARDCQLTRVGELLNNRYYALGVQKGKETNTNSESSPFFLDSPIRDSLNIGLLEMEENGKLENMRQKWWQKGGETHCQVNSS